MRSVFDLDVSVRRLAALFRRGGVPPGSVVLMVGAGISVSAGIPDFRSPGTGLYANLQKYDLPKPEAVFDIHYFRHRPLAFYTLAREMYPGNFHPTLSHFFIRLMQEKGLLRRCYSQNIDTLERQAGVDPELLVEAHGSFGTARCIDCKTPQTQEWMRERIFSGNVPVRCPVCEHGLVKPEIVFFGEPLPKRFAELKRQDMRDASVLFIMGTSLSVQPFAGLTDEAPPLCPRVLFNRDVVGLRTPSTQGHGLRLDCQDNFRDVALLGDLDAAVVTFCHEVGWADDLRNLMVDHFSRMAPGPGPARPLPAAPKASDAADAADAADATAAADAAAAPAAAEENHPLSRLDRMQPMAEEVLTRSWRRAPVPLPPLVPLGAAGELGAGCPARVREVLSRGEQPLGLPHVSLRGVGRDEDNGLVEIALSIKPAMPSDPTPPPAPEEESEPDAAAAPPPKDAAALAAAGGGAEGGAGAPPEGAGGSSGAGAGAAAGGGAAAAAAKEKEKGEEAEGEAGEERKETAEGDAQGAPGATPGGAGDAEVGGPGDAGSESEGSDGSGSEEGEYRGELDWIGLFAAPKDASMSPDEPQCAALGACPMPPGYESAMRAFEGGGGLFVRATLRDDRRGMLEEPLCGLYEVWYVRGSDVLCRFGPVEVPAPAADAPTPLDKARLLLDFMEPGKAVQLLRHMSTGEALHFVEQTVGMFDGPMFLDGEGMDLPDEAAPPAAGDSGAPALGPGDAL